MSWPAVAFTHSGGAERLRWWVEGIRLAGLVPVVAQDRADPLPGTTLGWLQAQGVQVIGTSFPRRGNLNGTDCAAGICETLAAIGRRHRSSHVLKVDDDTLVVDASIFTCASTVAGVGLTWAGGRPGAYGMAYALRTTVAGLVADSLRRLPMDATAPEDLTIWRAVVALAGETGVLGWEFDRERGPFAAVPWGSCPRDAVDRYSVVTVGNPPPRGWTHREQETAARLRQVVSAARARVLQLDRPPRLSAGPEGRSF